MIKLSSNQLKLIATISMTIDHIGYLLFPDIFTLRVIGRLAFPIYAYFVAYGIKHTSDINKYLLRMGVFAILTQVLFEWFDIGFVNVLFTYFLSIIGIIGIEKKNYLVSIIVCIIANYYNTDYSYLGIIIVYIFYYFENQKCIRFVTLFSIILIFILDKNLHFNFEIIYQLYVYFIYNVELIFMILVEFIALCALFLIDLFDHEKVFYKTKYSKLMVKYFFYFYYPLHLVIIKLLEGVI